MCLTLIDSQSNNISIDILFANKGKLGGFKMSWKVQNQFFHIYFLIVNISLKIRPKYFRFSLVIPMICMEGTVSQNFNIGLSSDFMS